jgi:DNA-binding GntR family transcriptional regulator
VREALRKLEAEGLIQNTPYKGLIIPLITAAEAREIYAIRALLEGYAAREFARHVTPATAAQLKKAVAGLHAAAKKGDRDRLVETKTEFYRVLLEGSENQLASKMLLTLLFRINLLRGTTLSRADRLPRSLEEIDAICECIYAGDEEGAEAAARIHVRNAEVAAIEVLESNRTEPSAG